MKYIKNLDINESLNEGVSSDVKKMMKAVKQGKTVYGENVRFPGRFKVLGFTLGGSMAEVDYEDGKGSMEMAAMNIDPRKIKIEESAEVNEGFSDKGDFRAMALALKDGKTITANHARFPASFTVIEIDPKGGFAKVDYNDGKGPEEMAAMNIDPKSIKLSESAEEITEAKKFKPGDEWSNDFDYDGMLKYALKTSLKTPIRTLNKLFDSATDVNYHTPFANLGIAIDWIEDGDKEGAKEYMDMFHADIKNEIKNQS